MPPIVTQSDTIEPPTIAMAALAKSHYYAERATVWKRRFAWAFTLGCGLGAVLTWAALSL